MKTSNQLFYLLNIFHSSIQTLEKNNVKTKTLKQDLKNLKFKILYNIKPTHNPTISSREILKILYLISFEENIQNNSLNRNSLNLLNAMTKNADNYMNKLIYYNPAFKHAYTHTFILTILYKLCKSRKLQ